MRLNEAGDGEWGKPVGWRQAKASEGYSSVSLESVVSCSSQNSYESYHMHRPRISTAYSVLNTAKL
jgi:hypothetical protein